MTWLWGLASAASRFAAVVVIGIGSAFARMISLPTITAPAA